MVKTLAVIFGLVFLVVGILGFVPAAAPGWNAAQHLPRQHGPQSFTLLRISSFCSRRWAARKASRIWLQIFGVIYAVSAIWGFAVGTGNTLWVVSNNPADTWLHVVLAVVMLFLGFGTARQTAS